MDIEFYHKTKFQIFREWLSSLLISWAYDIEQDTCVQLAFDIASDCGYCDDCDPYERFGRCR